MSIHRALLLSSLCLTVGIAGCQQSDRAPDGETATKMDTAASDTAADACEQYAGRPVRDTVTVTLQGGGIVVDPDTATAGRGGQVTWASEYPTAVFVQANQKGGKATDAALFAKGKGAGKVQAKIRARAPCGPYKYDVAVYDASSGKMLTLDPPLIIVP